MLFLQFVDVVFLFCLGWVGIVLALAAFAFIADLMIRFWKITVGIGLLIFVCVCIAEPEVFYGAAIVIPGGLLFAKILILFMKFIDRKRGVPNV